MKILFTIGNLDSGGAEKVVSILANFFVSQGHNVGILLLSSDKKETFYKLNNQVDVIPLLCEKRNLSLTKKLKLLAKKIDSYDAEVVISFLNYVVFYTYFALRKIKKKIKLVVAERNDPSRVPELWFLRQLRNYIFKKADGCVFQTEEAQSYFKLTNKRAVIPNPVFLHQNAAFDYEKHERKKIVLMVGSDKREKNRSMAFKAFALFHQTHPFHKLVIVGTNSNNKEHRLLKKLRIKDFVIFAGKTNTWHDQYSSSEMFILSSNFEGMPNALLEACALQIPCISTDCPSGGPRTILNKGKNGILVNVKDYKTLASEMSKLADSKELRNFFSTRNAGKKFEYDPKLIANKWIDFIKLLF